MVDQTADLVDLTPLYGLQMRGMAVSTLRHHGRRADALRLLNQLEQEITTKGIRLTPDHVVHGYFLAMEYAKLGEKERATRLLDRPLGDKSEHEFRRGDVAAPYLLVGRNDEAMKIIDDLVEPHWPIRAFLQAGQVDEALRRIAELPEPPNDERIGDVEIGAPPPISYGPATAATKLNA